MLFRYCSFLLCLAIVAGSKQWRTDYQFFEGADGWLKFHPTPANWDEARMRCQSEDAVLASPVSLEMKETMVQFINAHNVNCGVFTGLHDTYTKGYFHSIEGVPLRKIPVKWQATQGTCPEEFGDAIILLAEGTLYTARKADAHTFFCYKKYVNVTYNCKCGTSDEGYSFADETGSCYKFHAVGRTWHEAAQVCAGEGAQLVVINSAEEAGVLKTIFQKYPQSVMGSRFKNSALIGMADCKKSGWLTITGQSLEAAGYNLWSAGQPDHSAHPDKASVKFDKFCGAIFRDALLDDIWCDVKFAFICERTPIMIAGETEQKSSQTDQDCSMCSKE